MQYYFFKPEKRDEFLDGRTNRWLAEQTDMDESYISRILCGHQKVKNKVVTKLAKATHTEDTPLKYYYNMKKIRRKSDK